MPDGSRSATARLPRRAPCGSPWRSGTRSSTVPRRASSTGSSPAELTRGGNEATWLHETGTDRKAPAPQPRASPVREPGLRPATDADPSGALQPELGELGGGIPVEPPFVRPDQVRVQELEAGEEPPDLGAVASPDRCRGLPLIHPGSGLALLGAGYETLGRDVRQDHIAARSERLDEPGDQLVCLRVVGHEVEH